MAALPEPWKSLSKRVHDIEEKLRALANRSPYFGTGLSVEDVSQVFLDASAGLTVGGSLIVDGGDVVMLDVPPLATELFKLGTQARGDRGITIRRTDGTPAIEVRDVLGFGTQSVAVYDTEGSLIAGTGLYSAGLGAPYIPIGWTPVDYTSGALAQTTSATTWTALHEHRGFKENNVVWPQFMVKCSDGTTSAQVRLYSVSGGVPLAKHDGTALTINVPVGTTSFTLFEFADYVFLPGSFGTPVVYQVQVQRTAGTGSVSVAPVRSVGVRDEFSAH